MKIYKLPTGYCIVDTYEKGELETLSIGDYGKRANVKARFLGYNNDIVGVPNGETMPLSDKWVMTLSTQYGCKVGCRFCDVPKVKYRGNVSQEDLWEQIKVARSCFPQISYTERLNIHFARMGEPILNPEVFGFSVSLAKRKRYMQNAYGLRTEVIHPVLSTCLPVRFLPQDEIQKRLLYWCAEIKNKRFNGTAGLQLSINSTNEKQRDYMFRKRQLPLCDIARIAAVLPDPIGRKYCLNFAYHTDYEISGEVLSKLFDPNKFMVKITPIHNNTACAKNGFETVNGYNSFAPYRDVELDLIKHGFDVLIFIPSMDEEEGMITCGNAVLSGKKPVNAVYETKTVK